MFIEERHHKILEFLQKTGRVEVPELSQIFEVSEDSIRRDLRIMEEKGLVKRTYGGAILPLKSSQSILYNERKNIEVEKKTAIAKIAASFVEDYDTVILDSSSTIAEMVPYLNNKSGLTIITNSISIANDVVNFTTDNKLFLVGGLIDRESMNTNSIESFQIFQKITADKVFIGPCGISSSRGLSATSFNEANIKKAIIEAGKEAFILADQDKFGQSFLANIGPLQPRYHIITDSNLPDGIILGFDELIRQGLRITTG